MINSKDLDHSEFNPYYKRYIELVDSNNGLLEDLKKGGEKTVDFFERIPEDKLTYAYAKAKWTVLEILQHIIDTERIFNYRALCIARGDKAEFPGFEQDEYVKPSKANDRSLENLISEYKSVREGTVYLFDSFDAEALTIVGRASQSPLSPRAAGFIICGHEIHHANIIIKRYLDQ
ncbi:MAG: DinB family protein [Leeuwenhoekiella sp.]